jgi:DNA-binding GntR family transcriptional regulator
VRKRLGIILAKLAVEKATEDDLANIESCLLGIEEAVDEKDPDEYLAANNDFYLAIAEAGKNPFLKRAPLPFLEITMHQLAKEATGEYISVHAAELVKKYRDILDAVKNQDHAAIVHIMKTHFAASEEVFLRGLQNERHGQWIN